MRIALLIDGIMSKSIFRRSFQDADDRYKICSEALTNAERERHDEERIDRSDEWRE